MRNETARRPTVAHPLSGVTEAGVAPVSGPEPDFAANLAGALHRRQLTTSVLLLLASHRPLTFVTGQLLYALVPLGALLGFERLDAWAALLSAPDANARLTELMTSTHHPSSLPTQDNAQMLPDPS